MLLLCHLFIGLSLGLLLYAWLKEEWIILAVALGAILPDLIDKPLGHLLLNETLNNGRIFFHGLLAAGVFMLGSAAAAISQSSCLVGSGRAIESPPEACLSVCGLVPESARHTSRVQMMFPVGAGVFFAPTQIPDLQVRIH